MEDCRLDIEVTIIRGEGLPAKDRNFLGKKTSSDPFVEIKTHSSLSDARIWKSHARTKTISKSLAPEWNETFHFTLSNFSKNSSSISLILNVLDEDLLSEPDLMGTVSVQLPLRTTALTEKWYPVDPNSAKNAAGELQLRLATTLIRPRSLVRGNVFSISSEKDLYFGLSWNMIGSKQVDLDTSLVAVSNQGQLLMSESVYYAKTKSLSGAVIHSGDEQEGDEVGDDEHISVHLRRVPPHVLAFYIVLSVATPAMTLSGIASAKVRVQQGLTTICSFAPAQHAMARDATSMVLLRLARGTTNGWTVTPIEDTHPTARDFGSLIPSFKSYTKDLLSEAALGSFHIDSTERVAIVRKGGTVRLADYCANNQLPPLATFGLAWDVTGGINIDLDASAICLDSGLNFVDQVWFKQLRSKDDAIRHHGDEREGDEAGDDEKMDILFSKIDSGIEYVGFVINSYSGQELDDVSRASCHLFDPSTGADIVTYAMTDATTLNGFTALLVACLRRVAPSETGESDAWTLSILGEAAHGRTVKDNVDELQNFLRRNPLPNRIPQEVEEEIDLTEVGMPAFVPMPEEEDIDLSSE